MGILLYKRYNVQITKYTLTTSPISLLLSVRPVTSKWADVYQHQLRKWALVHIVSEVWLGMFLKLAGDLTQMSVMSEIMMNVSWLIYINYIELWVFKSIQMPNNVWRLILYFITIVCNSYSQYCQANSLIHFWKIWLRNLTKCCKQVRRKKNKSVSTFSEIVSFHRFTSSLFRYYLFCT